jgi:signal transduction histidine kinase
LADIGQATVRKVQAQAQLKLLGVDLTIEPPDLTMEADGEALAQLLYNLLDNAVKFTPAGGAVGLEIRRVPAPGAATTGAVGAENIQFVVWDTGIGIADAERARIFEAFTQVDGGLARRYDGMGLGLAYAQRMVGLLGGSVVVESAVGSGSRFVVTLPAHGERTVAKML